MTIIGFGSNCSVCKENEHAIVSVRLPLFIYYFVRVIYSPDACVRGVHVRCWMQREGTWAVKCV